MKKGVYFNIDSDLHRQLKAYALVQQKTMSEVLEELIRKNCIFNKPLEQIENKENV